VEHVSDSIKATVANKRTKNEITTQLVLNDLEKYVDKLFGNYKWELPKKLVKASVPNITREATLALTDLHFGSDLSGEECPLAYGKVEEARRLSKVIKETCNFKRQYRANTQLNVLLGGDIIEGNLHDPRTGAPAAEQLARGIWYLEKAIKILASEFPVVKVYCTSGNHGRNAERHPKRAVDGKWDSWETLIYYSVKRACSGLTNTTFFIPKTPYVAYPCVGKWCFLTHGDTVLNAGSPGKIINVRNIQEQVNKINAAKPEGHEYSLYICGHVHVGAAVRLQGNKKALVVNGCLVPPSGFSTSLGYFDGNCGQSLWESVENHLLGDYRFLEVDESTDKDTSLDSIIPAWPGF
jgi:hypothetical protein